MALCDATMMAGVQLTEKLETLLLATCLRIAAVNEGSAIPDHDTIAGLVNFPGAGSRGQTLRAGFNSHRALTVYLFLVALPCPAIDLMAGIPLRALFSVAGIDRTLMSIDAA